MGALSGRSRASQPLMKGYERMYVDPSAGRNAPEADGAALELDGLRRE